MLHAKKDRCLFVILAFLIIYNPPIGHFKSLFVLFFVSFLYIFFNYHFIKSIFKTIVIDYLIWAALFVYIFIIAECNDNPPSYLQSFIYILASVIPSSIMITALIKKKKYDFKYYLDTILYAGTIQCFLSIIAFFSKSIKNIFVHLMVSGGVFQGDTYSEYMQNLRLFGFSTGLTFGMPAVQAFLAVTALYLAINNRNHSVKYYVMIPLFAFSGIINARSSIVIMGIGIVSIVFSLPVDNVRNGLKRIVRIIGVIIIAYFLVNLGLKVLMTASPTTYTWIKEGISQIRMLFYGDTSSGYFSYLTDNDKWKLPSGFELLFGYGIRVMNSNKYDLLTDIGYVNDIYFGGVLYIIVLYGLMIKYIYSIKFYKDNIHPRINRFLRLFFLLSFIVLNYKGYVFDLNNFFVLFIMIAVFVLTITKTNSCSKASSR